MKGSKQFNILKINLVNWEHVKQVHKDQETEEQFMIFLIALPYFIYAFTEVNIE